MVNFGYIPKAMQLWTILLIFSWSFPLEFLGNQKENEQM